MDACDEGLREWEWNFLDERNRGTITAEFPASEKPIYTRDGKLIAIGFGGSQDEHKALIWDLDSKRRVDEFEHESKLICLAVSPDERYLAGGAFDGGLVLWDRHTRKRKWYVKKHTDRFGVWPGWGPDCHGELDRTLNVFDASNGTVKFAKSFENEGQLRKVMFSPVGRWIVAGFNSARYAAVIVNTSSGVIAARFPDDGYGVPTYRPDGRWEVDPNLWTVIGLV